MEITDLNNITVIDVFTHFLVKFSEQLWLFKGKVDDSTDGNFF